MKKMNLIYWISTGVFCAFMIFSSVGDAVNAEEAVKFMTGTLGYPAYFTPFIGWAKLLGVVALLVPGFPRIREWAYAGIFFDLIGATYSMLAVFGMTADAIGGMIFMTIVIAVGAVSYIYHHKRLNATA